MTPRVRRAARLVELALRAERSAKQRAAGGAMRLDDATRAADARECEWDTVAARPLETGAGALDLERLDGHLRTLRVRAQAAAGLVKEATEQQQLLTSEVLEASIERRKLELWLERLQAEDARAEGRAEQKAADQLAATGWKARP